MFGDAAGLVFAADHEAGDVLQEQQGHHPLVTELDEMRSLDCGFGEQHPVVRHDADWMAVDVSEPGDQGAPVFGFEFLEFTAVDDPVDDVVHVVGDARVDRDDVVQLRLIGDRLHRGQHVPDRPFARPQRGHDATDDPQRVTVVLREMVGDAGGLRMQVAATQILGRNHFSGRRFHQRWTAEKDGSLITDDHGLVAHCGDVGAARGARPQHRGDLRDALRAEVGLVEEDSAEVIAVGEHLVLARQERASGVDQINTRQPILRRDLLRP